MRDIAELILRSDRFVLTTHVNPDGDALGCELALAYFLRSRGKSFRILNCSMVPQNLQFLDHDNLIEIYKPDVHQSVLNDAGAILLIDTNLLSRLDSMESAVRTSPAIKAIIDHHPEPDDTGFPPLVDTEAPATGENVTTL